MGSSLASWERLVLKAHLRRQGHSGCTHAELQVACHVLEPFASFSSTPEGGLARAVQDTMDADHVTRSGTGRYHLTTSGWDSLRGYGRLDDPYGRRLPVPHKRLWDDCCGGNP